MRLSVLAVITLILSFFAASAQNHGQEKAWLNTSIGQLEGYRYYLEGHIDPVHDAWEYYLENEHGLVLNEHNADGIAVKPSGISALQGKLFYELKEVSSSIVALKVAYAIQGSPNAEGHNSGSQLLLKRFAERFLNQYALNDYTNKIAEKKASIASMQAFGVQHSNTVVVESAGGLNYPEYGSEELASAHAQTKAELEKKREEYGKLKDDLKTFSQKTKDYDPSLGLKFRMDWVEIDGKNRNAYTAYSELKPVILEKHWKEYAKVNLLVDLQEEAPGYYIARKADLAGITEFKADISSLFREYAGGTKMSVAVCPGYEICLNSKDYPSEFNRLRKFLKSYTKHVAQTLGKEGSLDEQNDRLEETLSKALVLANEIQEAEEAIALMTSDSLLWSGKIGATIVDSGIREDSEAANPSVNSDLVGLQKELIELERAREHLLNKINTSSLVLWGTESISLGSPIVFSEEKIIRPSGKDNTAIEGERIAEQSLIEKESAAPTEKKGDRSADAETEMVAEVSTGDATLEKDKDAEAPVDGIESKAKDKNKDALVEVKQQTTEEKSDENLPEPVTDEKDTILAESTQETFEKSDKSDPTEDIAALEGKQIGDERSLPEETKHEPSTSENMGNFIQAHPEGRIWYYTYTVKADDSLEEISIQHNMSECEIKRLNGIGEETIKEGDILTLIQPAYLIDDQLSTSE